MMAHLGPVLDAATGEPRLLAATRAVANAVNWYQIYQGEGVDPGLAEGMLAGQIAGQAGILASETLRTGLFLLAPGIHYPLHTHGASEIYYCMSGRLTLQHGTEGTPFELHPGDCSVTPANRLHSLATGEKPVLLIYVWIGDVDAANWWWERRPEGGWWRVNWSRTPDGSWAKTCTEEVTKAHLRQAKADSGSTYSKITRCDQVTPSEITRSSNPSNLARSNQVAWSLILLLMKKSVPRAFEVSWASTARAR